MQGERVYKNFGKKDWLEKLAISENEIPDGLLLYGIMNVNKGKQCFEECSGVKLELWLMHNIYRFNFNDRKIALAITYGSPMTSELVHIFSVLGTKVFVQIGSFGGLKPNMHVGDILLPNYAIRADGASDWYLAKETIPTATKELLDWLHRELHLRKVSHRVGEIFTTTAMLAETPLIIQSWSDNGYYGVDLETATTFAVAEHFGTKRAAILYLGDNIIEGRHFLDVSEEERELQRNGEKIVFNLALEAIAQFSQ